MVHSYVIIWGQVLLLDLIDEKAGKGKGKKQDLTPAFANSQRLFG